MISDFFDRDIRYLKGVGENRAKLFIRLGVGTVGALLRHYPRDYIDMRSPTALIDAPYDRACVVEVTVLSIEPAVRTRGGRTLCRVHAEDNSCLLNISFFNNKYTPAAMKPGFRYFLYGRVSGGLTVREMINPMLVRETSKSSLTPVYPLTEGLTSPVIANAVRSAFELAGGSIPETLPQALLDKHGLMPLDAALRAVHFPSSTAEAAEARRRLCFEELLTLQLGLSLLKSRSRAYCAAVFRDTDCSEFISSLPFKLTKAQQRSIDELRDDLAKPYQMSRLLQGDVGSGKTAVAAAGMYLAKKNGLQSAMMAPTEILAKQHADTLSAMLAPFGVTVGLLTSSVKGRARTLFLQKLASGEVDVAVGTHALIEDAVEYKNLAFVVADEQHRFGVAQRTRLSEKGDHPHMLVMSATPIPRTLALIVYGDLDISILDEKPVGRLPIKTLLVDKSYRERYMKFVRDNSKNGNCSYIVCPLVQESEALGDVESAAEYYERTKKMLPDISTGLLHGKMKSEEKNAALADFRDKKTTVLVCTTVVEVGMDIPDATIMIIENAERFGLSSLHQLRGRIGRSDKQSYCVLVSDKANGAETDRLKILTRTNDGFEVARFDLKARGPGDFFGKRQHGLPEMSAAVLAADEHTLRETSETAKALLADDPDLKHTENLPLRAQIERMFGQNPILN